MPSVPAMAVTKATAGTAGGGRSSNLEKKVGSVASPTAVASSASAPKRTRQRTDRARALSSQQKSSQGRRVPSEALPQSTVQATTEFNAQLAGSQQPSLKTMNAAAANANSRSSNDQSDSAAERGDSKLEMGPTKVVMEEVNDRRGGGGQPELSNREAVVKTRSGKNVSKLKPTLMAAAEGAPEAAANPRSSPMSSERTQVDAAADSVARSESEETSPRGAMTADDQSAMPESKEIAVKSVGHRASAGGGANAGDMPAAEQTDVNSEQRVARADQSPTLNRVAIFGQPDSSEGRGQAAQPLKGESLSADVQRRSSNAVAGSAVTRSPSGALRQTMATVSMPSGGAAGRRPGARDSVGEKPADRVPSVLRKLTSGAKPNLSNSASVAPEQPSATSANLSGESQPKQTMISRSSGEDGTSGPGAELDVDAKKGAAGLGETPSIRLGIRSRPASEASPNISALSETRFQRKEFGGAPAFNPAAVLSQDAFRSRSPKAMSSGAPSTEAAIQRGLDFLARHQQDSGGWSLVGFDPGQPLNDYQIDSDRAATGLAVLAFQGAGYNHREFKYAGRLQRALQWMMDQQQPDGGLYVESDRLSNASAQLYSHAIAALALTEAYGMTQDPELEVAAQKALDYISATQDRERGGWRYSPDPNLRSTDTSVTGWMMMALKSGRLAGLEVRPETLNGIESWLEVAVDRQTGNQFRYNPYAIDGQGVSRSRGRKASPSMTAVGLLMRVYSGWSRDDERFLEGARSLLKQLPSDTNTVLRDTYYWYYATQVLKHAGGAAWETWNQSLHPLLLRTQVRSGDMSGSWDPYRPVPDRWGSHGGRLYVTTLNLLSLEVRYRLLPLYENTVNQDSVDQGNSAPVANREIPAP